MKKSILLLHGFTCTSDSFFFPSLKRRYAEHSVYAPDLPSPHDPHIDLWSAGVTDLPIHRFDLVIAHSLGGTLALSLLSRDLIHTSALIMIGSSPGPKMLPSLNTFLQYPIDFPNIIKKTPNIITVQSLDDPWTFPEYGLLNIKYTKGYGLIFANKGHFETSTLPSPILHIIDSILTKDSPRLVALQK